MKKETAQAWGRYLRIAKDALGGKFNQTDLDNFLACPGKYLPIVTNKLMANHVGDKVNLMLAEILEDVDVENMQEKPDNEAQGIMWLAYYQFDYEQLTVEEAAKMKGCSPQYIYKLAREGKISSMKRNGKTIVFKRQIESRIKPGAAE